MKTVNGKKKEEEEKKKKKKNYCCWRCTYSFAVADAVYAAACYTAADRATTVAGTFVPTVCWCLMLSVRVAARWRVL